jgi:hypothetical protein
LLEQYMAISLEVQGMLRSHKASLMEAGWSEPEAWALCQRVEERILGPMIDQAEAALRDKAGLGGLVARVAIEERDRRN